MVQDPYLPPGCSISDIPGSRPEDIEEENAWEKFIDTHDVYDQLEWLQDECGYDWESIDPFTESRIEEICSDLFGDWYWNEGRPDPPEPPEPDPMDREHIDDLAPHIIPYEDLD